MKIIALISAMFFACTALFAESGKAGAPADNPVVYSVRIDGGIAKPQLYIIKRTIRAANEARAKFLVLDMDTPGGDLASTLEIMETLPNFKGTTVCYVNPNAISAGSFIASACGQIWFAPKGVMGAAEAVNASGGDIDKSMQRKLTSFMAAKVRAGNEKSPRRAEVQRAMNDPDFELKIGGKILKKKGELLTLTAKEALEKIDGAPLLADGSADSVGQLAKKLAGDNAILVQPKITWAENLAKYISSISPILLGVGFLLIFLEVKSGSFGILGGIGVAAILVVFLGANLCGMAGHEEVLVFLLGAAFVAAEIFLFTGTIIPSLIGAVLMLGSLVWALADVWPERGLDYNLEGASAAVRQVGLGLLLAVALAVALWKFLPKTTFWGRLVLNSTNTAAAPEADPRAPQKGSLGFCETALMPSGKIDVDGKIFDAVAGFGHLQKGDKIEIVAKKDFNFIVKKVE